MPELLQCLSRVLMSACDTSILRVARRFGRTLGAFRFPPPIANSLSEICKPLETVEESETARA